MGSRIPMLIGLAATLAVPQVFAESLPGPATLGRMESLLDSCSKTDPGSAQAFAKQRERLVQGVSEKELVRLRATDQYKGGYSGISGLFTKASQDEAVKACKTFLGTVDPSAQDAQ